MKPLRWEAVTARARRCASTDFAGKHLVLYFYPKDDTPGCTSQACGLRDRWPDYHDLDAAVFGVSTDSLESHRAFIERYGLPFPLLSDETGKIVRDYGVWVEKELDGKKSMGTERSTFVIDPDGPHQGNLPARQPRGARRTVARSPAEITRRPHRRPWKRKHSFLQIFEKLEGLRPQTARCAAETDPAGGHSAERSVSAAARAALRVDGRSCGEFRRSVQRDLRRAGGSIRAGAGADTPCRRPADGRISHMPGGASCACSTHGCRRPVDDLPEALQRRWRPSRRTFSCFSPRPSRAAWDDPALNRRWNNSSTRQSAPSAASVRAGVVVDANEGETPAGELEARARQVANRAGCSPEDRASPRAGAGGEHVHAIPARRDFRSRERPPTQRMRVWWTCSSPNFPTKPGWKWPDCPAHGRRRQKSRKR